MVKRVIIRVGSRKVKIFLNKNKAENFAKKYQKRFRVGLLTQRVGSKTVYYVANKGRRRK
jgi:hypothetical protein